jgi:hypothetical protein
MFLIDKITNSIEERLKGISHETDIVGMSKEEINKVHKKDGWFFNWKKEYKEPERQIFKLVIQSENKIQGLISLELVSEHRYVEMHLIENAPHNVGQKKQFLGVAGNLVAFACKKSFELGFDGYVAFTAKTNLVEHYIQTLGAQSIYSKERMAIFTSPAKILVNSYYKDFFSGK